MYERHCVYVPAMFELGYINGVTILVTGNVRTPAGTHFVVALSKSHLPCLVLVEPRKRWTDDRLGQTVTRLEITLCLMC